MSFPDCKENVRGDHFLVSLHLFSERMEEWEQDLASARRMFSPTSVIFIYKIQINSLTHIADSQSGVKESTKEMM